MKSKYTKKDLRFLLIANICKEFPMEISDWDTKQIHFEGLDSIFKLRQVKRKSVTDASDSIKRYTREVQLLKL